MPPPDEPPPGKPPGKPPPDEPPLLPLPLPPLISIDEQPAAMNAAARTAIQALGRDVVTGCDGVLIMVFGLSRLGDS